jgi:hypothetical protein
MSGGETVDLLQYIFGQRDVHAHRFARGRFDRN